MTDVGESPPALTLELSPGLDFQVVRRLLEVLKQEDLMCAFWVDGQPHPYWGTIRELPRDNAGRVDISDDEDPHEFPTDWYLPITSIRRIEVVRPWEGPGFMGL